MINESKIKAWTFHPISPAVRNSIERLSILDDIEHISVMPDVHLAEDVCIGIAIAARENLYPQAVGNDIGCGMSSIKLGRIHHVFKNERFIKKIYHILENLVPVIKQENRFAELSPGLNDKLLSNIPLNRLKLRDGKYQFGTIGRGNHFLEFQKDKREDLWLAVHTGSRGMGQEITRYHQEKAPRTKTGISCIMADSLEGQAYLNDLDWAGEYARLNRKSILDMVCEALGNFIPLEVDASSFIDSSHNHVRLEEHFEKKYWVHRKGAISAAENSFAIIPGSMGSMTYHIEGRGNPDSLKSASHGAGRLMSRKEARSKIAIKDFREIMKGVHYDKSKENQLRDEAPQAYKSISRIIKAQKDLVKVIRILKPVLNYKGV